MKRWIVNAAERSVRDVVPGAPSGEILAPGEFFWDGTYADAMAAGARRRLAEEALESVHDAAWVASAFTIVADRIEPQSDRTADAHEQADDLFEVLMDRYDVWREGSGLVVLGGL